MEAIYDTYHDVLNVLFCKNKKRPHTAGEQAKILNGKDPLEALAGNHWQKYEIKLC